MSTVRSLYLLFSQHGIQFNETDIPKSALTSASTESLCKAIRKMGYRVISEHCNLLDMPQMTCPAMLEMKGEQWLVVVQVLAEQVMVLNEHGVPEQMDFDTLSQCWTGNVIRIQPVQESGFGFRWLFSAFLRHRAVITQLFIATLILQCFALVTPFFFQVIVDKILVHQNIDTLIILTGGMVVIACFDVILALLRNYIFYHTITRIDASLGSKVFRKLMSLPFSYFAHSSVGQTLSRVRELENISEFLNDSTVTMIIDLAFTLVLIAVMYLYSPVLTLIVLLSIALYVLLLSLNVPAFFKNLDRQFGLGARNNSFMVENISGIETLKSLGVEKNVSQYWDNFFAEFIQTVFRGKMIQARGVQGVELISKLTTIFVLYFGANLVIGGSLTIGQLIAFSMLTNNIMMPVIRLAHLWQGLQKARVAVMRLAEILNSPDETDASAVAFRPEALDGRIELKNIGFSYLPDGPRTLDNISLTIAPGEVVGIVGRSGSGKSTLVRLLHKLYQPDSGQILYDGHELNLLDTAWLRQQIGIVLQDNVLFATTVKNNIAMADPSLSLPQVIEAAKMVGAHEFIMQLPQGYDTVLDERGGNLSGGQRQRIAIARALATNPRILIFDEATSALDSQSERIIQDRMKDICKGRTVIMIAHRLSTIREADRIVTFEQGRIAEQGTHEELCLLNGIYAQLHQQQTGSRLCLTGG
ncbi:peptidase domain-containing ABC transporter [Photobacterium galatheae]|nr:type I secretion system permease/ATPase [Photobacterium galatheae]MCM0147152.1 type I secretion system permease/ATPase [Photobacterium galatheae]